MARELFTRINFKERSLVLLATCEGIVDRYTQQKLRLTLRQLYYQLVTMNTIPNSERSYKMIGKLVSNGRLTGILDWSAIEDRVRVPRVPVEFAGLEQVVEAALASYRLDRWEGQDAYVELWVEKDALAGVLLPLAREFHVTLMVNRGYSSQSAMYDASKRFIRADQDGVLLYLGDHDPSGEDMVRDIDERLHMFGAQVDVRKIALTMKQIKQYQPPPNPAKLTDSRAKAYIERYGNHSWEVDALPPDVLQGIIRKELRALVKKELMDQVKAREEQDKRRLRAATKKLMSNR